MKRNELLVWVDTQRVFPEMISLLRMNGIFDITKTSNGFRLWIGTGTILSYMGISFKLAQKFLQRAEKMMDQNRVEDVIAYNNSVGMYKHCSGNSWNEIQAYDVNLIDRYLKTGATFYVTPYAWSIGLVNVEQGNFADAQTVVDKLFDIADTFGYDQAKLAGLGLQTQILSKTQDFYAARKSANARFSLAGKLGISINLIASIGDKIMIQIMLNDVDEIPELISQTNELLARHKRLPPYCIASYLRGRLLTDIHSLAKAMDSENGANLPELKRRAQQSGSKALKNARKYAPSRTITYKSMGDYYWLVGKQKKARQWWDQAIKEGKRLNARPDLSRTYFEIGKHMLEPSNKLQQFNGMDANGYLEKAGTMFAEMGLEKDLEELQQVRMEL